MTPKDAEGDAAARASQGGYVSRVTTSTRRPMHVRADAATRQMPRSNEWRLSVGDYLANVARPHVTRKLGLSRFIILGRVIQQPGHARSL